MKVLCIKKSMLVILLSAGTAWGIGFGGYGGSHETTFQCRSGKVIEIYGYAGDYLNKIGAICSDESFIDPVGGAGGNHFDSYSESGFAGMEFRADWFVDAINPVSNAKKENKFFGGSGGKSGTFMCPRGESIIGFKVRYGEFIDNLEPLCGKQ